MENKKYVQAAPSDVSIPPHEMLQKDILERRRKVLDAIEKNQQYTIQGAKNAYRHEVISSIYSLWVCIQQVFEKDGKKSETKQKASMVKKLINIRSVEAYVAAFNIIDEWLYDKQLTRWDVRKKYDVFNIEEENNMKGL